MKVLIITNLFPNEQEPQRGVFNKQQFDELKKFCDIKIIAPLAWSLNSGVKSFETIDGFEVHHPRYLAIPVIGRNTHGWFLYRAIKDLVAVIYARWQFDVILATWVYPDAYAASLVSRDIGVPFVVKVHGTDVNVGIQLPGRRQKMKKVFEEAKAVIAVSSALKNIIEKLGVDGQKIAVLTNGINAKVFYPQDQNECQKKLGMDSSKRHVVYIGNLVPIKGAKYLIEAFKSLRANIFLHIVGDGVLRKELERLSLNLGLNDRVRFYGKKPHQEIPIWLNAADVFCLPSENEGCPNVVLESLACGTPVVASNVGAVPDLIENGRNGCYVTSKDSEALKGALEQWIDIKREKGVKDFSRNVMTWEENAKQLRNWL